MAHDIFISYSSLDKETADMICSILEENGISCWMAPRNITPGVPFAEAIIDGIKSSKVFILIHSSNSNNSNQVIKEVDRAVHHGLSIINFRLEDIPLSKPLEYYLSDVHWLDAFTPPMEQHIHQICSVVQMFLKPEEDENVEIAEALRKGIIKQNEPAGTVKKSSIISGSIIASVIIILGILFIPKLFNPAKELEKSFAVLPFINDSPDEENTYFINGIMDEILNNLQKIKDFRVLSRTSTEQYRGTNKPPIPKIAKALGVNYIVEGSGQKYGNTFRLRVQLIAANNEKHLWGESYEQEIKNTDDIFSIQVLIAKSIATELKTVMTPQERQLLEKTPTSSLTAHDFYLRGKEEQSKYSLFDLPTWSALERAANWYKKALEYDPEYAQAYTGLAGIYWDKHYLKDFYSENFQDSAIILCNIALSFDNQLSEAFSIKGRYYSEIGKSDQALQEYDKAIQYNPNDWTAYNGKGFLYSTVDLVNSIDNYQKAASLNRGDQLPDILRFSVGELYMLAGFPEKAYDCWKEALNLDGDSAKYYILLSGSEFFRGNFEKAGQYADKVYSMDSTTIYLPTFINLFLNNIFLGNHEKSLKYLIKYLELIKTLEQADISYYNEWIFGYIFWKNGYKEEADYFFDETIKNSIRMVDLGRSYAQSPEVYYDLAAVYAFRGATDKAYENLRIFSQQPCVEIKWGTLLRNDPLFSNIRNEPEFQQIVRKIDAKYQAEHERVRKWLEEQGRL
jgi:TolB-like protein/Tfp pilus assembly protein PilF